MTILLVCAGNICRSPIAEGLFRHYAAFHAALADVEVASAGTIAIDGLPAAPEVVGLMAESWGLDISGHRARRLQATTRADLALALDAHVLAQAAKVALAALPVELLGTFAGFADEEVSDPYGGALAGYSRAGQQIDRMVRAAVARLARERARFDLEAYLARIGHPAGPLRPTLETLVSLHRAHVEAVPFENLDIQMGHPVHLDIADLQRRLVGRQRGGYCFEQNTLFAHVLRAVGFEVEACEARVRSDGREVLPRTHMVLVVTLDTTRWLCDVGFGGHGPFEPVAFDAEPHQQSLWTYRLAREGSLKVLQLARGQEWLPLYAFLPEPRYPVDFEMADWYTSTQPQSRFVTTLTVQRSTPEARYILRNLILTTIDHNGPWTRDIAREDLVPLLRDLMMLDIPLDARFRGV